MLNSYWVAPDFRRFQDLAMDAILGPGISWNTGIVVVVIASGVSSSGIDWAQNFSEVGGNFTVKAQNTSYNH